MLNAITTPSLLTTIQDLDYVKLKSQGIGIVFFQVQNGESYKDFDTSACKAAGIEVGAWGVTYEQANFARDGSRLASQANKMPAQHLMMDAEYCLSNTRSFDGASQIIWGAQMSGWNVKPIHLTTLGAPAFDEANNRYWDYAYDLQSFLDTGGGIFPQAYAQVPGYSPSHCKAYYNGQLGVPLNRLNMMIDLTVLDDKAYYPLLLEAGLGSAFSVFDPYRTPELAALAPLTKVSRTDPLAFRSMAVEDLRSAVRAWRENGVSEAKIRATRVWQAGNLLDPAWFA